VGVAGAARSFDGITSHVDMPLPELFRSIPLQDFTVFLWFRARDITGRGTCCTWIRLFEARADDSNFVQMYFAIADGRLHFNVSAGGTQHVVAVDTPVALDRWYHVTGSWQAAAAVATLYLDGVRQSTAGQDGATAGALPQLTLGRRSDGEADTMYRGDLDELRLARTTRAPCWVEAEYRGQSSSAPWYALGTPEATGH
jgi:hypothetical protein